MVGKEFGGVIGDGRIERYKAGKVRCHKKGSGTGEHKYQEGEKYIRTGKFHRLLPCPQLKDSIAGTLISVSLYITVSIFI